MTITRTALVSSTDPDTYADGAVTSGAGTTNVTYTQYPGDKAYGTQRASINIFTEPDDETLARESGRGVFFWGAVDDYYFVNDNDLYKGDYSNDIGNVGEGDHRIYFTVVGTQLVIIDPVNSEGWYINEALPSTLIEITDGNFPGAVGVGKTIVGGAVSLDGFLFIMTEDGFIYNSNLNAVQTWTALDFISTDTSSDGGLYLAKHHNHVCALGENSIEFFYNAGNPVGSPLQLRQDISYLAGAVDFDAVTECGDDIFFIGREKIGTMALFQLRDFKPQKVSPETIDSFIQHVYDTTNTGGNRMKIILGSSWFGGNQLCFMTSIERQSGGQRLNDAIQTLVYDATTQLWSIYETGLAAIDAFEVFSSPASSVSQNVSGFPNTVETTIMFTSGALATVDLTNSNLDLEPDASASSNISMNITTVEYDYEMMTNKFASRLSVAGTTLSNATDLTPLKISWSDDRYRTTTTQRDLDTGLRRSLTRLGDFKRRAWIVDYSGVDTLRLEALEFDIRGSQYA